MSACTQHMHTKDTVSFDIFLEWGSDHAPPMAIICIHVETPCGDFHPAVCLHSGPWTAARHTCDWEHKEASVGNADAMQYTWWAEKMGVRGNMCI
jgi:hypothetical protein